jgi:hypothetical protein
MVECNLPSMNNLEEQQLVQEVPSSLLECQIKIRIITLMVNNNSLSILLMELKMVKANNQMLVTRVNRVEWVDLRINSLEWEWELKETFKR